MYVSTATGMFLNWRRKKEEGEKNGNLLVPGWRFCPARGHEGGGSGVRGWKFEKNNKYKKNMKYDFFFSFNLFLHG